MLPCRRLHGHRGKENPPGVNRRAVSFTWTKFPDEKLAQTIPTPCQSRKGTCSSSERRRESPQAAQAFCFPELTMDHRRARPQRARRRVIFVRAGNGRAIEAGEL